MALDGQPRHGKQVHHPIPVPDAVNVEQELTKTSGSQCYAKLDFTQSYCQLLLHKYASRSLLTTVFSPSHASRTARQIPRSTGNRFSLLTSRPASRRAHSYWSTIVSCMRNQWTDLVADTELFLRFWNDRNWKLNPNKCTLYTTSVKWCSRVKTINLVRHEPSKLQDLMEIDCPETGDQLQQVLCAMQWLMLAIRKFQHLIHELQSFFELVYTTSGKRTKRAVSRLPLNKLGWSREHTAAFVACKSAIANRTKLAHSIEENRLCIYKADSDSHWPESVTQVFKVQLTLPNDAKHHDPLAVHSGQFSKTQRGWSSLEKEPFAVLATTERSNWIASCADGLDHYTDHNNLIFIFDPLAVAPDLSQVAILKVICWSVRMSVYNYTFLHIRGSRNVWADLLTPRSSPLTIRRLVTITPLQTTFKEFDWPNTSSMLASQEKHASVRSENLTIVDGLWRQHDGRIWIPDNDTDLQLRLTIIAHTGAAGHLGRKAREAAIAKRLNCLTLSEDLQLFVSTCMHCLYTTRGESVSRPSGPAFHGTKPNAHAQFDDINVGMRTARDKYILMLKDDHSAYCWFYQSPVTKAETAADSLIDRSAAFGTPEGLMSDGPTHSENETVRRLTKGHRTHHHFTLTYCPWSNGAIERLGKELIRVVRSLMNELQLRQNDWPKLETMIQSAINNVPSPLRNNFVPITAFTDQQPSTHI